MFIIHFSSQSARGQVGTSHGPEGNWTEQYSLDSEESQTSEVKIPGLPSIKLCNFLPGYSTTLKPHFCENYLNKYVCKALKPEPGT